MSTSGSAVPSTSAVIANATRQASPAAIPEVSSEQPSEGNVQDDVTNVLHTWAKSIATNDPATVASYYAPNVAIYYGKTSVDNAFVLADKEAFLRHGNEITRLDLGQISFVNESPTAATVRFDMDVTWEKSGNITHKILFFQVNLQNLNEEWKITAEQNYKPSVSVTRQ
ncbi:hypothetical protein [Granulicella mallensis]|uniref:DUF4440 domain-containing protein n=1 Tax=Granulicella mallensis TaxID=940614 RepID=A0A7W8EBT8_9BACT|nr:hypothetical protein [Granulicella mallensis]MBB5066167.1 hypothetical protein [Granulicella mallensis]